MLCDLVGSDWAMESNRPPKQASLEPQSACQDLSSRWFSPLSNLKSWKKPPTSQGTHLLQLILHLFLVWVEEGIHGPNQRHSRHRHARAVQQSTKHGRNKEWPLGLVVVPEMSHLNVATQIILLRVTPAMESMVSETLC